MKTFLSLILGTFVVFAAYAQEQTATQPGPQITFEEKTFDFGDIQQGLICVCTKDLLYQGFEMNQELLAEYEDKWFDRVKKFYKNFKTSSPKV